MKDSWGTPTRAYAPGIGTAVADRTVNRRKADGTLETWEDVSYRVALGNSLLRSADQEAEFHAMHHHLRQGSLLLSGRHLQHGDENQPNRPQEVFTNCLDRGTRVLTLEHGPIEIGKIAGQVVTVIAGDGQPRPAAINAHGEQDLFEIEFVAASGGISKLRKTVTATANHRWKLRDGAVTTELAVGDVIAPIASNVQADPLAVVHGIVFGDGSAHKSRIDATRHFSQGRTYASIRVCKQDCVRDEIHGWLDAAGYSYTLPPSADGDRVYYIGKFEGVKDVPFSNDPEYIAGFIYGWWLADGHKGVAHAMEISTANEGHASWLAEHSGYAGLVMTTQRVMERVPGDGSFPNGRALHVMRLRRGVEWRVKSITPAGRDTVYCPEEPVTGTFVLANGLLTGNCATAAASFMLFYLLLNGSGVGRAYDDDMMLVDWAQDMPELVLYIDPNHPDVATGEIHESFTVMPDRQSLIVFEVPDSREGWAKAVERIELLTFKKTYADRTLVLDFSKVRHRGQPIAGMQGRPASGPGTLMTALSKVGSVRGSGMAPWLATMHVDHHLAECVLVGGARRAARMATKTWRDGTITDFIEVKRGGVLWSSNNSVTVDEEFWEGVQTPQVRGVSPMHAWAHLVADKAIQAAYHDGTGEPGIITVSALTQKNEGLEALFDGDYAKSARFQIDAETLDLTAALAKVFATKQYTQITNPCVPGDTPILTSEGYVQIGDVIGTPVDVWNGQEFSTVTPFATGLNATVKVMLSDGSSLRCTPAHKFVLHGDRYNPQGERREAGSLQPGDRLAKYQMPVVERGEKFGDERSAYSQGFYSGDGNTDLTHSWLYAPKYICESRLVGTFGSEHPSCERKTWYHGSMRPKFWVPIAGDLSYCLNWLAGVLDADGAVCTDREGGQSFQLCSTDRKFLEDIRLMLTRLGAQPKFSLMTDEHEKLMPDGKGGMQVYYCRPIWRLVICGYDAWKLVNELGMTLTRLSYTAPQPNRSAARFVEVVAVLADLPCETFCFTEPKNHTGTFNGVVTGQCGEISLGMLGGYCVIADVVPFHAGERWRYVWDDQALREWDDDVEHAFRTATRALLRVNLMDCLYGKEVERTNRIGVGFTGIHEYAWARFKLGWKGLVDLNQSAEFWLLMSRFSNACVDEARKYSAELGTVMPHTVTTVKPAGTTSKLFALTEGAHLPSMREYLRWVQFRHDDPLIEEYRALGYPVKELKTYTGTTIVGFPTVPAICTLGMGDKLVTAAEATPDEQYTWLQLLETYWIDGADVQGNRHDFGNQVSYTLKYKPELVDYATFRQTFISGQSSIRCCSVMPQIDGSAYEYQPEQPVTREEFEAILAGIKSPAQDEDIGLEHVDCGSGGCPIDFSDHRTPQLADMWPTVDGGVDPSPAQEDTTNTTT